MIGIISKIKNAFTLLPQNPKNQKPKLGVTALVQKFSLGNMNLSLGRYVGEGKINARREAICTYFANPLNKP